MNPAVVLREQLADARRRGATFEAAWPAALAAALQLPGERDGWQHVLAGMWRTWKAAYDRTPAPSEAFGSLAAERDHKAPAPAPACLECGVELVVIAAGRVAPPYCWTCLELRQRRAAVAA